ncbi:hypothetical protein F6Q06_08690 [Pectobacterium parmentieri]|uniref:Carboxylic ester hydrolase n=1 Tax=Pectobacterium parmentieri TaxID=1905730 RepID=A0ABS0S0M5_PECPM|nr:hypothetical protein [Pectobacterium parmentieri]MBI0554565.1 hypothetical protein [Pectobacterium parmentieri]
MPLFRESGGVFAPIQRLDINDNGAIKNVIAAWVCDNGTFKPVFPNERQYHDPSAYYDISNATNPSVQKTTDTARQEAWLISPCHIPVFSTAVNDVDWSIAETIVISTGEPLMMDAFSTGGAQPSCKFIEFKGGNDVRLGAYHSTNRNLAVTALWGPLAQGPSGAYNYLKPLTHPTEFSDKYNKQLGVRWRWHSTINDMYFEHIFTNASMIIMPL